MKKILRQGYTTGACAAAAARGAALMIASQELVSEVTIMLPAGTATTFQLHGKTLGKNSAACFVVKDAGDDPDVTNGAEVHAAVTLTQEEQEQGILITGGEGIGKVTKPGLAVAPGEWAINPVPRQMITEAVRSAFSLQPSTFSLQVVISIPDGEQRAKKTLNARLGIIGGLSILGTTGIVRPISAKAWTDTIDAALDVAKACGCENVVLSTGRSSEMAAQNYLIHPPPPLTDPNSGPKGGGRGVGEAATNDGHGNIPPTLTLPFRPQRVRQGGGDVFFPEEAFIMMGDYIAYALRACLQRSFDRPIIACQFAKLLKIACGYGNTHAAASELDLATLREWATEQGLPGQTLDLITGANTARQIIIASDFDPILLELVCRHAHDAARSHAPGILPSFLMADYGGNIVFRA